MVASCNDFDDDNLDFSNSLNPYVEFNSPPAVVVEPGVDVNLQVTMRVAIQNNLSVAYTVTGDVDDQSQVVIPAASLSSFITIPGISGEGQAIVTLVNAQSEGSEEFTVGRGDSSLGLSTTSVEINWANP